MVGDLTKGIAFLFKKNGVDLIEGWATIPAPDQAKVGDDIHKTRNILIATGSGASPLPGVEIDEVDMLRSTGALSMDAVPDHLVAIGRRPILCGLGLKTLGVAVDARRFIEVDAAFQSTVPGIYAIGDCVPGPMLAHKAEEDGVASVEMMAGQTGHVDYNTIPGVVYTDPEVASVGQTKEALKAAGTEYISGKFTFTANSRARSTGETDGAVKVLAAPDGTLLGAHICGAHGGNMIAELVLTVTKGATISDVTTACHAHPSMAEAIKEACLDALGRAIHA